MFRKIKSYLLHDLWECSLQDKSRLKGGLIRFLRVAVLSLRGFYQDGCTIRASSLTFYTLMSVVPILALSFAIARGFGYQEVLKQQLIEKFQDHQAVLAEVFTFSDRLLAQTQDGVIAAFGIAVLFWSATQLLMSLENALNHIWEVHKSRTWNRLFTDYLTLILVAPFFFIFSSSFAVLTAEILKGGIFLRLIPFIVLWVLFSFLYSFVPNLRVRPASAWLGGFVAAALYLVVQWGYIYFQVGVTRYGAIYGSFAALPLFLIWVQLNWFILLFGAEVSFAFQSHEQKEYNRPMSLGFCLLMSLWVTQLVAERFLKNQKPVTLPLLLYRYQMPHSIAAVVLDKLTSAGILIETKEGYLPRRDVHTLRLFDVIKAIEKIGASDLPRPSSKSLGKLEEALRSFEQLIQNSPQNRPFKELIG